MENEKNMDNGSKTVIFDIQKQKNEWRKKGWSIPDIRGGKQIWYTLVKKLVELVDSGQAYDLDSVPDIYDIMIFQKPGTLENTAFPAFSVSNLLLV